MSNISFRNIATSKGFVVDVNSPMVRTIAFSYESSVLMVKFRSSGACYSYLGVSAEDAEPLLFAQSVGKRIGAIQTKYRHTKLLLFEFDESCRLLSSELEAKPKPLVINWPAVSAAAELMVWH